MSERENKEEKNKRIGWLTSIGVQLVLLVLFYFIIAWREPFPPIPEYGIELGFTTSAGEAAAAPSQPVEAIEEEAVEEDMPEVEQVVEELAEEAPVEEQLEEEQIETVVQEVEDVPVVKEESTKKVEEATAAKTADVKKEAVESRSVMKPSETVPEEKNKNPSDGKEENKEIDERAIYGTQGAATGNAEGASLALSGWVWDFKPKPEDESDQLGKIVYKIVVDQDGYLVKIETVTSTVSPAVERKYRQAVEKLTFSKTAEYKSASFSTGSITFIIKPK